MSRITIGKTCWKFDDASLGDCSAALGGYLICKSGGTAWVVASESTEVQRNWYDRDDAVTTAEAYAACGDWFVPTCTQLKNPGYTCRIYWDSYSSTGYWSSSQGFTTRAWGVNFLDGSSPSFFYKAGSFCVRAFRCVSY